MIQKKLSSIVAIILVLSMLSAIPIPRVQASSQTSWVAPLPYEDALLNQTLTTYKHDTYAEVGLSANLYVLQKDYPQPGQYEMALAVVAAANSRYQMGYTASYTTGWIEYEPPNTLSLGDNAGAWVDTGSYGINYYGAWYRKIFVSSNGFVVLDQRAYNDGGGKWTSPTPKTIPSTDEPNVLVAPFWRDLDPSRGGRIKYGDGPGGCFMVAWLDIPNKANSNTQSFAVYFYYGFGGAISFIYDSITNDVPTSIGIEDQSGKRGLSIASVTSGQRVNLDQNSPGNFKCITQMKVSASKLTDSGTNDADALIHVDGLDSTLPGGVNVELYDPSENKYQKFPIVSAATFTLSTLALATGFGWIGMVGYMVSGANLVYQLSPMPSSTVNEADQNTQTAYVLNQAQDENRPDLWPWDVSIYALFRWRLLSPSVTHRLVFNVQVDYGWPTGSHTISTNNLELKLTPGSVSWYGRTNPDAHYYNFYQISTPYGQGYHVDSIGSNDYSYNILGWSKLTDDAPEDYKVGTDGKIRVKGYFRQSDTLYSYDQPGRRLVNAYVMYSDDISTIVKTVQILDYTDGTSWVNRGVVIDGLIPGKSVKIGIGRPDSWYTDWNLVVEWAGVEVYGGDNSPPSTPSKPSGTTNGYVYYSYYYSTSTTDSDGDNVRYVFNWGDGTTTTTGYYASGAMGSAYHYWSSTGTYLVKVQAQDVFGALSSWSSTLSVSMTYGGGGGCPILFVNDGTQYLAQGLLNIHTSDGVDVVADQTLGVAPFDFRGTYLFKLVEHPQTVSYIDQVMLYAVLGNGATIQLPLIYAWHSEYGNVLPQLRFSDDWRVEELGANHNNGVSQSIQLKFLALPRGVKVQAFIFQIEGHNWIVKV